MTAARCRERLWLAAGIATWLLTIGGGLAMLWAYADTPGPPAVARAV